MIIFNIYFYILYLNIQFFNIEIFLKKRRELFMVISKFKLCILNLLIFTLGFIVGGIVFTLQHLNVVNNSYEQVYAANKVIEDQVTQIQHLENNTGVLKASVDEWKNKYKKKPVKYVISQGVADHKQYKRLFRSILVESKIFDLDEVDKYVGLLLVTVQVESDFGRLVTQKKGPAVGWFQMEPNTEKDIWENYLKYNPKYQEIVSGLRHNKSLAIPELQTNIAYATVMAALQYKRYVDVGKIKLPNANDKSAQAKIWKKYYNTYKGKGDVSIAMLKSKALK